MDSLTHILSRKVYFIHYSNSLEVTALDMFKKKIGFIPLNHVIHLELGYCAILIFFHKICFS